ncbi:hypothetical protein FACS189467_7060 [Bacteroidia bacterium]|nr:hypothetical protein FACS189467_7060 [Bacteroidia bacterium]
MSRKEDYIRASMDHEIHNGRNMTVQQHDDMNTLLRKVTIGQLDGVFANNPVYFDHDDDIDGKLDKDVDLHDMVPPQDKRGFNLTDAKALAEDYDNMKAAVKEAAAERKARAAAEKKASDEAVAVKNTPSKE